MATKKKLLQAAAGNAGGDALNVEDVFSTYLYTGNSTARSITNGIDLASEGGLTWIKSRSSTREHSLYDTERGVEKLLKTNSTGAEQNTSGGLTSFNSNGFSLGTYADINGTSYGDFASWTFRKAPKFFDVVTYTGTGSNLTINHNLGSVPGCIIIKCTSAVKSWVVYHRGVNGGVNPEDYALFLNTTSAQNDNLYFQDTAPTSTQFFLGDSAANENGQTHVAYIFAHNDGDGDFGPDGDADIIKCGSYTGNGNYQEIDLGFEAQWVMIKRTDSSQDWMIFDVMRGMPDQGGTGSTPSGNDARLKPNKSDAEQSDTYGIDPHANGFAVRGNNISVNGSNYIYIAIRRPTAVPESATEVFDVKDWRSMGGSFVQTNFPVDLSIWNYYLGTGTNSVVNDRLRGVGSRSGIYTYSPFLITSNTNAESTSANATRNYNNVGYDAASADAVFWSWKRAPKFFDVVAYTGTGGYKKVDHNLTTTAKMIWIKRRDASGDWGVYFNDASVEAALLLNSTNAAQTSGISFTSAASFFRVFNSGFPMSNSVSGATYIAYLFASLDGISKVGSVTHSGTTNVDCGFSSGARFVLLKRTDATGDWYVWDSERGIVSGNDPYLLLNTTGAEVTNTDYIDPLSSGFTITSSFTAGDYIFYAIA